MRPEFFANLDYCAWRILIIDSSFILNFQLWSRCFLSYCGHTVKWYLPVFVWVRNDWLVDSDGDCPRPPPLFFLWLLILSLGSGLEAEVGHTLRLSLLFTLNLSPANEAHCHSRTRQRQGRCCAVYITYSVSIIMMSLPLLLSVFRLNWS